MKQSNMICKHQSCILLVPIFNHLEAEQMDEIKKATTSLDLEKGEFLYHAGESSSSLYIVGSGKIRIYRVSESGKEQLLRILYPGDFTGELALFNESIHQTYAEAMESTRICTINKSNLQKILLKYPTVSLKILEEFSNRLNQSEKQTTRFATEKVETRLALFLSECVEKDTQSLEFKLPMSKKDIASHLGTTPETISRKLAYLEEQNLIKQKTHNVVQILDLDQLLII